jgi:hypothetical protein
VSAFTLRRTVEDAGGILRHIGGELIVKAPTGTLKPDIIADLRAHKGELLALLEAEIAETRRRAENALLPVEDEAGLCIRGGLT